MDSPVAIVTGAGTGIGRHACLMLAEQGYALALVGRRTEKLDAVCAEIAAAGNDRATHAIRADLLEPSAAKTVVDATVERWGRLDCLVNNAGGVEIAPIEATGDDLLQRTFEVNAFSPARLIAASWPIFQRQRSGCVVNVSSRSTLDPFPGLSVYAAAKSALESLTRSIINEGRSMGITAYTVAPGAVETPMLRALWSEDELPPSQAMAPDEVARVIVDCILGRREQDLGQTIRI
jgi:NAD(P)-dependent dehydrogenase (short-subunit alcohol dehydrogenase family)